MGGHKWDTVLKVKGRLPVKKILITLTILAVAVSWIPGAVPGKVLGPIKIMADAKPTDRVVVYQFHRRFRCEACYKLEKAITETLDSQFPEQLADGTIVFNVVDLDGEDNGRYEKRYAFFYNTVIIAVVRGDEDLKFKNIEKVWQLTDNRDELMEFVRSEVEEYLKDL